MDAGILIRFGKLVPGREHAALDVFADAIAYFGKKMESNAITFFEPYFFTTGDQQAATGFMIAKGQSAAIYAMIEEDEFLTLVERSYYTVEHMAWELLTVGDGVSKRLERGAKVRAELGVI